MTGIEIVGALLYRDGPLTTKVPAANIKAGMLPEGASLPALLVRTVSSVDRQPLVRGSSIRKTDRIAITVRAASYADQLAIVPLISRACVGFIGAIAGAARVSVLSAGLGPDVVGPNSSYEQTFDLRVSFDAAT